MTLIDTLDGIYREVEQDIDAEVSYVKDDTRLKKVLFICRNIKNKAPIRFLLSCLAAKIDKPDVDVRKPYTATGEHSFSGRGYDESVVQTLIARHNLPCNNTTAYLTPAFRNRNEVMVQGLKIEGRPAELYDSTLAILTAVHEGSLAPVNLLREMFRQLIIVRDQNARRINELIEALGTTAGAQPLSSEQIITLLEQHLNCANASRLPTLIIAAAYQSVDSLIGETAKSLNAHNAADKQTGAIGDVEITVTNEDRIATCYEMKDKAVTRYDIDVALSKIAEHGSGLDNYIFITTESVDEQVAIYTRSLYARTGVEFAVLDCISFLRHFLHLFHRHRAKFLESYQSLVLAEPDSSVSQPLKETFLTLRRAAETE